MPPRRLRLTLATLCLLALTAATAGCTDQADAGYQPSEGDYLLFDVAVTDPLTSINGTYRVEVTAVTPNTYTVQGTPSEDVAAYLPTELEIKDIDAPLAPGADVTNMTRIGDETISTTHGENVATHYQTRDGDQTLDVYLDADTELLLKLTAHDPAADSTFSIRLNDTNIPNVLN